MNTRVMMALALGGAFAVTAANAQAVSTQAGPAPSTQEENAALSGSAGPAAAAGGPDGGDVHGGGGRVGHVEHAAHLQAGQGHAPHVVAHHLVSHHHRR